MAIDDTSRSARALWGPRAARKLLSNNTHDSIDVINFHAGETNNSHKIYKDKQECEVMKTIELSPTYSGRPNFAVNSNEPTEVKVVDREREACQLHKHRMEVP
jgi:hypothetical protein